MSLVAENIYDGRNNISLVTFKEDGTPIDFSGATRFLLTLGATIIDTAIDAGSITTTVNQGQLRFDLGGLSIPAGSEFATLVVFDPAHTDGQVIVCASDKKLSFESKVC